MSARRLVVIGAGGHGRVVADIARALGRREVVFLDDDFAHAPAHLGVIGPVSERVPGLAGSHQFIVAIGDAIVRSRIAEMVLNRGGSLATLVHPSAVIAPDVEIGDGTVVMAGAVVNTGTRIGRFCIVNTRASVDHDNLIEHNVQICPGATLAGRVVCRHSAFIGTGATIIPKIEVGSAAVVAAGATVIRNVRPLTMVAGCPAVEKRVLEPVS